MDTNHYTPFSLSAENLKTNVAWGDLIQQQKTDNITRVYCQNVNGFKLDPEGGQYSSYCKIHQEIQADITCCQEINLDTTQHSVNEIMMKTTKRHWQRSRLTIGSTPIAFSGQYKPGGTLILSTRSITGRHQLAGTDPWGRWSFQTFIGHNACQVTIISAYRPALNNINQQKELTQWMHSSAVSYSKIKTMSEIRAQHSAQISGNSCLNRLQMEQTSCF
jgi:exonuclease III